jgi:menaquinol-cytochrome c reductase cytochrome b/c subunit
MTRPTFEPVAGEDARQTPTRLLVVQEEARPAVDLHDDEMVMTFPHLVVRELIALVAASLFIVVISLLFDAPLEELANPQQTPNPAKAPWYFLGLQELLHYYPPLISGVVLPGLVVAALVVVPYFDVNLAREPFWERNRPRKITAVLGTMAVICLLFYVTGAHPVWPLIGSTLGVGGLMLLPGILGTQTRLRAWLGTRSLAFWVFVWFLVATVALTVIGVLFRGPGWSLTLPWVDGIY